MQKNTRIPFSPWHMYCKTLLTPLRAFRGHRTPATSVLLLQSDKDEDEVESVSPSSSSPSSSSIFPSPFFAFVVVGEHDDEDVVHIPKRGAYVTACLASVIAALVVTTLVSIPRSIVAVSADALPDDSSARRHAVGHTIVANGTTTDQNARADTPCTLRILEKGRPKSTSARAVR